MIALTLAALILSGQVPTVGEPGAPRQPKQSLLQRVAGIPSGKNGYEDYLQAADLINGQDYADFVRWRAYRRTSIGGDLSTKSSDEAPELPPPAPFGLTLDSSELAVRSEFVHKFEKLWEYVKRGNEKPVFDPRAELDFLTLWPELAKFKDIAKFGAEKARIEYAAGSPSKGTETLLDVLVFSQKIGSGSLISALVGIAAQAIALASFEQNLGLLSLRDCRHIEKVCERILAEPLPIVSGLRSERENMLASMTGSLDDILKNSGMTDADTPRARSIKDFTRGMNADTRAAMVAKIRLELEGRYRELQDCLGGAESKWIEAAPQGPLNLDNQIVDSESEFIKALTDELSPLSNQILGSTAKARVQLRLLRLHAKILAFRWENDRLPKSLEEAVGTEGAKNAITGGEFDYTLGGPNGYKLSSKGFGNYGEIELRYKVKPDLSRPRDPNEPPRAKY